MKPSRIFTIDVGKLDPLEAKEKIDKLRKNFKHINMEDLTSLDKNNETQR
jgi:hypothetical protein